jgi:hypothetical protein
VGGTQLETAAELGTPTAGRGRKGLSLGQLPAQSRHGEQVDTLFDLFKIICRTQAVEPHLWEQHARLHARFFVYFHTNTHPYYHREGLWLSAESRARDGLVHLCYCTALLRAWGDGPDQFHTIHSESTATGASQSTAQDQEEVVRQQQAAEARPGRVRTARAKADAIPQVMALAAACPAGCAELVGRLPGLLQMETCDVEVSAAWGNPTAEVRTVPLCTAHPCIV